MSCLRAASYCWEVVSYDPNQPSRVLFGSRTAGLQVTEDGGDSWQELPGLPKGTGDNPAGVTVVVFDAKSGTAGKPTPVIYAAAENATGSVFKSSDAGKTWTVIPGQPQNLLACHMALDTKGILWAAYENAPGPNDVTSGAVYALDTTSGTAKDVSPLTPTTADHFGYSGLSIDPANPGTVVVTIIERWGKHDIYRTTDSGQTWRSMAANVTYDANGAAYVVPPTKPEMFGWMVDIDIDPFDPDHAIFVTGGGVWSTQNLRQLDAGKAVELRFTDRGIEETATLALVSPPVGAPLLSGLGDVCGFRHDDLDTSPTSGNYKPTCQNMTGLDFAEHQPDVFVRVGTTWTYSGAAQANGALSTDGGKTWQGFPTTPAGANVTSVVAITSDGSSIVWALTGLASVFSSDRGKTWQTVQGLRASKAISSWSPIDLQLAADREDPKRVVAYDPSAGSLLVSTDGGASFSPGATGIPAVSDNDLAVAHLVAVPGQKGHLWLSTGKALYRSTDGGATVQAISAVTDSYGVGHGKAASGSSYPTIFLSGKVGGQSGFFLSTDEGKTWRRISDNAHQYGVQSIIAGDPRVFGRIYIGAYGRGIIVGEPGS
jgi:xyloglucan-specific exo-beta-1,4-glucanase